MRIFAKSAIGALLVLAAIALLNAVPHAEHRAGFSAQVPAHRTDETERNLESAGMIVPSPMGKPAALVSQATRDQIARLRDPAQKQRLVDQARIRIATSRRALFQMLRNLPPGKLDRLSEILAVSELDTRSAMLDLHSANPSPSGQEVESILSRQNAARDANARTILDDGQYAQYTAYWESEPYTQSIVQIADVMRAQGSSISPDLQQQMLTTYASVEKRFQQTSPYSPGSGNNSTSAPPLNDAGAFDQSLADAMSKILTPEDFGTFMDAQNKIDHVH
jgi:hypothetical protein